MQKRPLKDRLIVEKACGKYGFCLIDGESKKVMVIYEAIKLAREHERKEWEEIVEHITNKLTKKLIKDFKRVEEYRKSKGRDTAKKRR